MAAEERRIPIRSASTTTTKTTTMTTSNDDAVDVDVLPVFDRLNINDNNNNNDEDEDNRGLLLLTALPLPLLILIVNIVGTQEDLTNISVLSKQFHMIVSLPAIDTRILRIYAISPSKNNNRGSGRQLLQRLVHNRLHHNEKFMHYHHLRLNRINEFDHDVTMTTDITDDSPPFSNFESLDLSLPYLSSSTASRAANVYILYALRNLLPNVQDINLTYVRFRNGHSLKFLTHFFRSIPSLQKITYNHCDRVLELDAYPFHSRYTKQIFSDDSIFLVPSSLTKVMMSNLERHDDMFMFSGLKSLECLSIRNAKYATNVSKGFVVKDIPQNILIKFVRNAPTSMRWFRSNLTEKNRAMLQQERPGVQLLN